LEAKSIPVFGGGGGGGGAAAYAKHLLVSQQNISRESGTIILQI